MKVIRFENGNHGNEWHTTKTTVNNVSFKRLIFKQYALNPNLKVLEAKIKMSLMVQALDDHNLCSASTF